MVYIDKLGENMFSYKNLVQKKIAVKELLIKIPPGSCIRGHLLKYGDWFGC